MIELSKFMPQPNSAWKPSDEQMDVLLLASGYLAEKYNRDVVDSLYND